MRAIMQRSLCAVLLLAVGACSKQDGTAADASSVATDTGAIVEDPDDAMERDASVAVDAASNTTDGGGGGAPDADDEPLPSGPPVEQGAPNVPEFKPAFPQQTRAPAIRSQTKFQVTTVASFATPWAVAFLPDQRMLVTEKLSGKMYVVMQDGKKSPAITGIPAVAAGGQGGLLDVEVGPDYAQSNLIYWTYYEARGGGTNGLTVARGKLNAGATPSVSDVQVIFKMMPALASQLHAGGRLVFAPDGMLFVTLGERSILQGRVQARDLNSHLGKVVRIKPDGTAPSDIRLSNKRAPSRRFGRLDIATFCRPRSMRKVVCGLSRWGRKVAMSSTW
jgi:aldose sugar dehydrogenase